MRDKFAIKMTEEGKLLSFECSTGFYSMLIVSSSFDNKTCFRGSVAILVSEILDLVSAKDFGMT